MTEKTYEDYIDSLAKSYIHKSYVHESCYTHNYNYPYTEKQKLHWATVGAAKLVTDLMKPVEERLKSNKRWQFWKNNTIDLDVCVDQAILITHLLDNISLQMRNRALCVHWTMVRIILSKNTRT